MTKHPAIREALLALCPDVTSKISVLKWMAEGRSSEEIMESMHSLGLIDRPVDVEEET